MLRGRIDCSDSRGVGADMGIEAIAGVCLAMIEWIRIESEEWSSREEKPSQGESVWEVDISGRNIMVKRKERKLGNI